MTPTNRNISYFNTNGFWIAPKLFEDSVLASARDHLELLRRKEYEEREPPLSNYRSKGIFWRGRRGAVPRSTLPPS